MEEYPVVIEVPIAWGDMDAFGHVNNTVYFRLFESARIAYLDRIDFRGQGSSVGPILASTHCRFRRALVYPDTVKVSTRVTELDIDRFTMEYRIISGKSGELAAEGGGVVVAYDYAAAHKTDLPNTVHAAVLKDLADDPAGQ
jgi:acyl-CoA thioester hydrolase